MKLYRINGFTLVELMIVVAIVGILATIAVPSYNRYVVKASRETAQTELLALAAVQEKVYLNSNAYTPNITTAYNGTTTGGLGRTSGKTTDGKYDLNLNIVAPSQTYMLTAKPVIGGKQEDDGCITIQEDGRRLWHENIDACDSPTPKTW